MEYYIIIAECPSGLRIVSIDFHVLIFCWYILLAEYPCELSIVSFDCPILFFN